MKNAYQVSLVLGIFLLLAGFIGCAEGTNNDNKSPRETAAAPATAARAMTAQEKADILAVEAETKPNAPYRLDMTNPLHYRFVVGALARAGETPAKSPEFFRRLTAAHQAKPAADGKPRAAVLAVDTSGGPTDLNFISSFSAETAPGAYQATGLSSVPGGTQVTLITMEIYNVQTGTVFAVNQGRTTQYSQGTDFQVQAAGQSPPGIQDTTSKAEGVFTYIPVGGGNPEVVYYRSEDTVNPSSPCMSQPNYCVRDGANCVSGQYQTACTNTVPNTTPIKACWYRGSQQECDYWNSNAHPTDFVFPVSGSVQYPNNTVVTPLTGFVYIALQNPLQGGGCNVFFQAAGPLDSQYWTLSGTTVSWNYPAAAFPNTGDCINFYDGTSTNLWMTGNVLLQGSPGTPPPFGGINFTSDRNQIGIPGVSIIPGMYIMQGCFAAGTPILQADGSQRNIEDFKGGGDENVMSGQGAALMVSGTTKGTEPFKDMVRIKTGNGHQILVTETHPVITAGGEPVMAKNLKAGDKVRTREGDAELVSVTREAYQGKVYNLRLGDPVTTDEKGSTLYAGGILTGDSRMQNYYDRLEKEKLEKDPNEVLKRLPQEWMQDFRNHQ
jgi:hypothetical protein